MNDNEYGKTPFYRTDDGKKEMRVSSDESAGDIIGKLKEHAEDGGEPIDQIRVVNENGYTEKMIYSDKNQPKKKQTPSSIAFCIAVVAFMAAVLLFMLFAS